MAEESTSLGRWLSKVLFDPAIRYAWAIYLATGSYIAARAGNRVFLGHWAETMDYAQKIEEAKAFFGPASDEWRKELLRGYNVSYLIYGPREKALLGFEPRDKPYLVEVYANPEVLIYELHPESEEGK